jgi:hypothetical protein
MANCTFIRPRTFSALAIASVWRFSSAMVAGDSEIGRQRAGAVAGVDAGFLDMLHDAGDEDVPVAVGTGQSTSTSMASDRYWSIRIGLSPETFTACLRM